MTLVYLDSSALVKLVVTEPESTALMEFLRARPDRVSSAVALTEVPRALRRAGFGTRERRRARELLARVALVDTDRRILAVAAALDPPALRTLDAIHLASAMLCRERRGIELSFATHDPQQARAARALGFDCVGV